MPLETLRAALGWCTLINWGVLLFWGLLFLYAHDWLERTHRRWFDIRYERFDEIHYRLMGLYKIGILLLNLAPYLALRLVS